MNRFLITMALAAITVTTFSTAVFAADVGVSLSIGQPGFYGRLNIGGYPQPQVLYRQPIAIERVPMNRPPIYLRVPPGHAKRWKERCHDYNACGERVLFVQDRWYNREYVTRFRENQRGGGQYNRQNERRNGQSGQHRNGQQGRGYNR
ncbi:MAG: hypothetical protein HOP02_01015 [Methylococcaceae bacterium]|nr:hypothetical protein [Methylococcaceae bacterium]